MRRRTFLVIVAGFTAVGAGVVVVTRKLGGRGIGEAFDRLEGFGRMPVARLRRHYAWLEVDPEAFTQYLAEYQKYFGNIGRFSVPDESFYTRFLLSTDFFEAGQIRPRNGEPVRYVSIYLPAKRGCYNPLASAPP